MPTQMSAKHAGKMKVAELERRSGTSRSSIRHYMNLGLLPPCSVAGPKLHLFGEEHLAALAEIKQLRKGGLSLAQILPRVRKTALRASKVRKADAGTNVADRIVAEATLLFVRMGYERVKMEDLATALRMSKPTIYRYFPSKQELFLQCVRAMRFTLVSPEERLRSERRDAPLHAEDRIRLVLRNFEAFSGLTRILASLAQHSDPALRRRAQVELHEMITNVVPFLQRGQAAGRIKPVNAELLAYMLWGALMAAGDRMILDEHHSLDSVVEAYKVFVNRGMLTRAASGPDSGSQ